jgi:hypothetical protein
VGAEEVGHFWKSQNDRRFPVIDHRPPPPQAESCLCTRYPSSQKGGTLIDERVLDLETHEHLLRSGGYRPACCPRCNHGFLHIHDYRVRYLLADPAQSVIVVRFWCPGCGATWQVLPAFVARHLWRSWPVVETATEQVAADEPSPKAIVPGRTRRRWLTRLRSAAALLVAVFGTSEQPHLIAIAGATGGDGTRGEFVAACTAHHDPPRGRRLAEPAGLLHRLAPGVRLM